METKLPLELVLVIQDPKALSQCKEAVKGRGRRLSAATSVEEAVGLLADIAPALVICDMAALQANGLTPKEACAKLECGSDRPLLVINADEAQIGGAAGKGLPALLDCIPAPLAAGVLKSKVNVLLAVLTERDELRAALADRERELAALGSEQKAPPRASPELKDKFLANMSHEMRTPITAVLGYAELLEDSLRDSPRLLDYVLNIHRNSEHLLCLINDILDLSKVESGRLKVEQIACCPFTVVSDSYHLLRTKSIEKGIMLKVVYQGEVPESIQSDPTRILQCLVNLIDNAIKFTPASGMVQVIVSFQDRTPTPALEFRVVDTGIGIAPEGVRKIFQPFEQATVETTRQYGGTGLGLSITKRLAGLLDGQLTVESHVGQGSTFSLVVSCGAPTADLKLVTAPSMEQVSAQTRKVRSKKLEALPVALRGNVLLAEDFPDTQKLVAHMLERGGAKVGVAGTGPDALEKASKGAYDLVLMDMQLPGMDGITVVSKLRGKGYKKPIIALTADATRESRDSFIEAGCNDVATKPINRMSLLHLVSSWLTFARNAAGEITTRPRRIIPSGVAVVEEEPVEKDWATTTTELVRAIDAKVAEMHEAAEEDDLSSVSALAEQVQARCSVAGFTTIGSLADRIGKLAASKKGKKTMRGIISRLSSAIDQLRRTY